MIEHIWYDTYPDSEPKEKTLTTHCPCCGHFRPECVCFSSYLYNQETGEHKTQACEPSDHGRDKYGFD